MEKYKDQNPITKVAGSSASHYYLLLEYARMFRILEDDGSI